MWKLRIKEAVVPNIAFEEDGTFSALNVQEEHFFMKNFMKNLENVVIEKIWMMLSIYWFLDFG